MKYATPIVLAMLATALAHATDTTVTVDAHSMPWTFDGGINSGLSFGTNDGSGPAIVDGSAGIGFFTGNSLTITYVSGLTSAYTGTDPYADGIGDTTFDASDNGGSSGMGFPSRYVDSASYPVYLAALIGTFADDSGNVVGTPFYVGNGPLSVTVPAGATRLQLGLNDDIFSDNSGALNVQVSGAVPEPATFAPLGLGAIALLRRRRR